MTKMDYEKILKSALQSKETPFEVASWIKEQFSELAESEDEKIKKQIIYAIKELPVCGETKRKCIAWLEKQGEKEKFVKKELDCIRGYREEAIRRLQELEKQGEQKHQYKSRPRCVGEEELLGKKEDEWSEEDEKMRKRAICACNFTIEKLEGSKHYSEAVMWLKSLRPQKLSNVERNGKNWRPSEEQLEVLNEIINDFIDNERHYISTSSYGVLKELLEQLKAL